MDYRWRALVAVGFGSFMATMDFGIVNLALPRLAADFDQPPDVVVWVALVHSLVVTGLTLTAGRAGDLYGRKRIYLSGWCVFTLGLTLAPLAASIEALIGARLLQAVGMSLAIANSNAIVIDAFPDRERGRALGIITSVVGAGLMSGPSVGGFILSARDWPAIFYLRIPIAIVAIAAGWRHVRESGGGDRSARLDLPGALTLFIGLAALLVALNRGQSWGWVAAPTLGLSGIGVALLLVFARIEAGSGSPILSPALLRMRNFAVPVSSIVLIFIAQACVVFVLPFYLLDLRGLSPARSGLVVSTVPLMMLFLAPFSGLLFDRYGSRLQATSGLALAALGLLGLSALGPASGVGGIVASLALSGLGLSIFGPANASAIFASVPRESHGTASASIATARNVGNALGLALYSVVLVAPARLMDGVVGSFSVAALFALGAVVTSALRASTRPE